MNKFLSRKFVLTVLFAAIVILNSSLDLGLDTASLALIAGSFGVYTTGNIFQKYSEDIVKVSSKY